MQKLTFFFILISLLSYSKIVVAQAIPRLNPPPLNPPSDIQLLPPLEEILPILPSENTITSPLENIEGKIIVKEFKVIGNTVFSEEKLREILDPYINTSIEFRQLVEAQEKITQLYIDNGYITSGAFIPQQTISQENTIVTIQVIEGKVESIEINGLRRLQKDYVRSRLMIGTQSPLNKQNLLQSLQLLQINPLLSQISAELIEGTTVGNNILRVNVMEANAFFAKTSYDNYRNPSVGTNRILGEITHNNLIGWGDRFNVTYSHTDGSDSLDDLSYTLPVNAYNGKVSFAFRSSESKVIYPEIFEPFDLESNYEKYELTYRQPLYETANQEFALGITTDWQNINNYLLGESFPLSRGADSDGKTRIFAIRFFQEYNRRSLTDVFLIRSQFNLGISAFGSTNNNDKIPDGNFFAWRGQSQYLKLLTPDIMWLVRGDLQLANKSLLPVEQFSLGGVYTVRGYSQDALLADNGFFASSELRGNILQIPHWKTTLQISPFFDFGTVWNNDDISLQKNSLASVGLGLKLLVSDVFSARIDYGIPLINLEEDNNTLQGDGVYFSFELIPF
ncbi:ShlB/FhaC/HecB family hemolysin secretion/activation protein [Geminocystis sp. NIES-3709]|uniref:ShlB/FhaC/HecB family hemolysin secretion/activation protein n=1 Tax=Geminocystis sp. NIES-3709 TaxID=1617448 RepID=UPI0005FC5F82|nr:ShlB/FhaC/HecB family hemolysin secretion/activation protein [Geminocystis sp. NIES-3709]BAQ65242.1 hemolysin activation/secretion protein [Geminocystis sp. NIES-3709]